MNNRSYLGSFVHTAFATVKVDCNYAIPKNGELKIHVSIERSLQSNRRPISDDTTPHFSSSGGCTKRTTTLLSQKLQLI